MISPADDEPDPRGDTAQIRLADVFGDACLAEYARHARDRGVGADADVAVDAELDAADANQARTARLEAFARFIEVRPLFVVVRRQPGADVRPDPRQTSRPESVATGDLQRRDRRCERNAETEILSTVAEGTLARLVEA